MRMFAIAGAFAAVMILPAVGADLPKPPTPTKEHEWLKQLDGEWETEGEAYTEPGKPPVKTKGTMSVRSLGGFWAVGEMKSECFGVPVTGLITIGYDPQKKKYVGTWVCSMSDWQCSYEGTAEEKVLTLNTEGPSPADPKKTVKMRDVIEIKDKDTHTLTSAIQGDDGKWATFMTMTSKRKK
jgi:hypothetical protein